jgi:hypothetical protein
MISAGLILVKFNRAKAAGMKTILSQPTASVVSYLNI